MKHLWNILLFPNKIKQFYIKKIYWPCFKNQLIGKAALVQFICLRKPNIVSFWCFLHLEYLMEKCLLCSRISVHLCYLMTNVLIEKISWHQFSISCVSSQLNKHNGVIVCTCYVLIFFSIFLFNFNFLCDLATCLPLHSLPSLLTTGLLYYDIKVFVFLFLRCLRLLLIIYRRVCLL